MQYSHRNRQMEQNRKYKNTHRFNSGYDQVEIPNQWRKTI